MNVSTNQLEQENAPIQILFVSLGCDKNLVDTEVMLGILSEEGYAITDDEEAANVAVVNTCCFIGDAKEESINTLLELGERKKEGKLLALVACGCLAQRYKEEIEAEIPEVDAILGTASIEDIAEAVKKALKKNHFSSMRSLSYLPKGDRKRISTTGGHYAYLKIAEGCNKHCSYCIIPKVRGDYRSVPMEELLSMAEQLATQGVKELILVAQETTIYGTDIYGKKCLPELLEKLCRIDGLVWIRILYCYPEEITQELIDVMKKEPKICHYLDIPIQHCCDRILKLMGRRTTKEDLLFQIARLREEIPDIVLRTTLITGFPSETEEEHQELVDFVDQVGFERLGVFPYSPEEGTRAAAMEEQVDEDVKLQRRDELMQLQQEIAFSDAEDRLGTTFEVIIEGYIPAEDVYVGRTYMDAPGVDGYVFVEAQGTLVSGDYVKVLVTDAKEYDLVGVIVSD